MLTVMHKRSLWAIQVVIYLLWPSTIFAAQVTLSNSITGVPIAAWVMVFILSTVSSLAALLSRLKVDTPPRLALFVTSHVLGSWLAGLLSFLLAQAVKDTYGMHDFVSVVFIALSSYAGATLMDRASSALTNRVASQLEQGANVPTANQKPQQ